MNIAGKIEELGRALPKEVTLIAVSKMHSNSEIMEAYIAGQRDFGESRPQELCAKYEHLPRDIRWHLIGHLQTNKVRSIAPFVSLIHSVDSEKLLNIINDEAQKAGRVIDVLLEVRIAVEESKHGWTASDLTDYLASYRWRELKHIRIKGVMSIASNTDDMRQVKNEFETVVRLFERWKEEYFGEGFETISLGMTSDYMEAIEAGSNMVRIGSMIFGSR